MLGKEKTGEGWTRLEQWEQADEKWRGEADLLSDHQW